jgi:hypothetical protein
VGEVNIAGRKSQTSQTEIANSRQRNENKHAVFLILRGIYNRVGGI